jgi:flagellar protein FlbD
VPNAEEERNMIELHRLGQAESFHLNPDLIVTVEAHPDSVITLATGTKVVVAESPDEVSERVRDWRVSITNAAWRDRRESAAVGTV